MKLTGKVSGDNAIHIRELSHAIAKRYFGNNCFAIEITHATEVPRPEPTLCDPTCFEAEYEAWPEHDWQIPLVLGATCKKCEAKLQ